MVPPPFEPILSTEIALHHHHLVPKESTGEREREIQKTGKLSGMTSGITES